MEIARTDALLASIWPVAVGRSELIEDVDEGSEEQKIYVVLPKAKLDAIDKGIKLLERRSRYLGLDFSDGIAERQVRLAEQQGEVIGRLFEVLIESAELGLSREKKATARGPLGREMRALAVVSEAR